MLRPLCIVAMFLLAGCEASSEAIPAEKTHADAKPAEPAEAPASCRADDVAALAKTLADADPKTRREAVVGLKDACELPEEISAFLHAEDATPQAKSSVVAALCEGDEALLAEADALTPAARAEKLFDGCGLGRLDLVERDAWLRTNPTTVMPFATMAWLEAQGIAKDDAKEIASAMLLRARRAWGVPSQQVPLVGGTLAAVPANAIEVAMTTEAVYIEGSKVLDLKDGKLPEPDGDDAGLEAFERALLAEREAKGEDAEVTIAVVVDARLHADAVLALAGLAPKVGAASLGWVVQSEPQRFGMLRFDVSDRALPGRPKLDIDARGFTLAPPGGGTPQHVGLEGGDNPYDFEALAEKARAYAQSKPTQPRAVMVDASEDTPAGVLLATVHHLHGERCATDSTACWFDDVTVQQGVDPDALPRHAGILGVLSAEGSLASPYGSAFAVDPDEDVWGDLTGTEVGEAFGAGGLGLVGTGRGGGGTGEGTIGLGNTGMIGKGSGTKGPRVRQGKAVTKGALDEEIIRRIVRAHINEVRLCYQTGLKKDEALAGRVTIDFTIGATGSVAASKVATTTVDDAAVGTCIAKAVKRWKFPKPRGGGVVVVTYPFVLEPK